MPLDRILVATDFSESSSRALAYAAAIARRHRSRLFLTHVLTTVDEFGHADPSSSAYQAERQAAERGMAGILASKQLEGLSYEVRLEDGFLWQTLDRLIRKENINLVAVGTHGVRSSESEFMGSNAELIFRHADCPVLTAGPAIEREPEPPQGFEKILFATDFGKAADHAARYAFCLARDFRAALTLLNVVSGTGYYCKNGLATLQETTRIRLTESVPDDLARSCKVECEVRLGDASEQILQVAREKSIDLIVMGARSGRPLATHLPEPAAYTIAINAPCPVITVRS